MKFARVMILFAFLAASCSPNGRLFGPTATPTATLTPLPAPRVLTTRTPGARAAAQAYLDAWQREDFAGMYAMLSADARKTTTEDDFIKKSRETATNLTLEKIETSILSATNDPATARVTWKVTYNTHLFDKISREITMDMVLEDGQWKVKWDNGLILPELKDGSRLVVEYTIPERGSILDRNGAPIAQTSDVYALGLVPGRITQDTQSDTLTRLAQLTGRRIDDIVSSYAYAAPEWYIPVGEATNDGVQKYYDELVNLPGVVMNAFKTRYAAIYKGAFYSGGVAPQVTGYIQSIPNEKLDEYRRQGYRGDEKVGVAGLEKWGENYLAGKHGASLNIENPQGQSVSRLSQVDSALSQNITTTIDRDFQIKIQKSFGAFRGAAVVLERDTGRVLAMVSSPAFDPNLFEPNNYNSNILLPEMLANPEQPLVNRAAQAAYPLGSVFKVITMAAALESKVYTPESTYECGHEFTELPGTTLYDWTYDKGYKPSGHLNLSGGLIRSCNPFFWHIGLDMYRQGYTKDVANMARAFGLGSATGIQQVAEETGVIPDAANEGDAVQLAIGQGSMLVTPLQVARFIAALGNGGTLYRPQLVEKITQADGTVVSSFQAEPNGSLPLSPATLKTIQDAMVGVIFSKKPLGTARSVLGNLTVPVAGKTGTATVSGGEKPHSWFGGYTFTVNDPRPNIAVAIIMENSGEGSEYAAPLFKRIIELYYSDFENAGETLPWETKPYIISSVTPSPTPTSTATPAP